MAPESIKKKAYSKSSDVYMFAIIITDILSYLTPNESWSMAAGTSGWIEGV